MSAPDPVPHAPAPHGAAPPRQERPAAAERPPALGTLFAGVGLACARPRVWLPLTLLVILLAWAASEPVHDSARAGFGHVAGFEDDADVQGVPQWMFDDWERLRGAARSEASAALAPLLLLASLLGVWVTMGWMWLAVHGRREHGLFAFGTGGGQYWWPGMRLWVLTLAGYALVTWIVYGLPGDWLREQVFPAGDPERATSENHARWMDWLYAAVYLFGLLKVEILTDLARASLVVEERRSALGAWFRALGLWFRRALPLLALVGGGLLLEAGAIALLVGLRDWVGLPLLAVALLAPALRVILRGGRASAIALYYQQVRRPARKRARARRSPPPEPLDEGTAWADPSQP